MKNRILLALTIICTVGNLHALSGPTTKVLVINKTPFDLQMSFWGQDGGPAFEKANTYVSTSSDILAKDKTSQILEIERRSIRPKDADFYFREDITLPNVGTINLKQKVHSKLVQSDIWIAVAQNNQNYTWYDNDPDKAFTVEKDGHKYSINYYYQRGDGTRDDAVYEISYVKPVDEGLRYDQVTFLTAHNAFSSRQDGWAYAQQFSTLDNQLKYGVRGFMLDVYDYKGDIQLCHGSCGSTEKLLKSGQLKTLTQALAGFKKWLDQNPNEVLTVFLENYVNNDKLAEKIRSVPGLEPMILTKKIWDPNQHNGEWPTLKWMRENNKRIVFFDEDKSFTPIKDEHPFYSTWDYITESQYGTGDTDKLCVERKESATKSNLNRKLFLFNYFNKISEVAGIRTLKNDYDAIKNALNTCKQKGLAGGRKPNFFAFDFVDSTPAPKQIVQELNNE